MDTLLHAGLSNALMAAALALPAAAVTRFGRRPALAHALWLLVLLKLLTPPLIPIPILWPDGEAEAGVRAAAARPGPPPGAGAAPLAGDLLGVALPGGAAPPDAAEPDEPLPEEAAEGPAPDRAAPNPGPQGRALVVAVWLAVSALWFVGVALQVRRFRRLLRHARPAPAEVQEAARALAARLGRAHPPTVWLVPGVVSPMLWALGQAPRLLFPAGLLERLEPGQRDALLAHELAHWRRRDHWVRLVELAALGLYWWHPLVWWARHELHEAEEQCCDAWAVWALDGDGRTYAMALLQTVSFLSQARPALPVGASGVGQVRHLRRRLTMVLRGNTYRSLSSVGAAAVCVLGLLLLPLLPVGAQDAPAGKRSLDKQIEALREALRILEAQNAAQQKKERGPKRQAGRKAKTEDAELAQAREKVKALQAEQNRKAAELAQAREKVKALQKERDRKAEELAKAREQVRRAERELAQLEGKGGARGKPGAKPAPPKPPKAGAAPRAKPAAPVPGLEALKALEALPGLQKQLPDKLGQQLQREMEQLRRELQREMEQLQRELRGRGQPNPPAPPKNRGRRPPSEREDS
jgi:beta-lactamase regulating signal transducer with metallopeptidase domain